MTPNHFQAIIDALKASGDAWAQACVDNAPEGTDPAAFMKEAEDALADGAGEEVEETEEDIQDA